MGSPSLSPESALPSSTAASKDAIPRVKILCSFLGSILPRLQDGKLRYVGGETHIVSVPRDITYAKLMTKMRELYCGAAVLKYQQPDEDLDALASVTNDEDVINMMEECDKLASRDSFCRLRIFLFLHPEQDGLSPFVYGNERRLVDSLNSLNVGSDFMKYGHMNLPLEQFKCGLARQVNSAVNAACFKDPAECSARHHVATDGQNPWVGSPEKVLSSDGAADYANVPHGHSLHEGNHICKHCGVTFCRNQSPHLEHPNIGNDLPKVNSPGAECPSNREAFLIHADGKLHLGFYSKDQNDHSSAHGETQGHKIECSLVQQVNSAVNAACFKDPAECSARHHVATDGQNPWVGSPEKVLSSVSDIDYANVPHRQETQDTVTSERVQAPQDMLKFAS
ncbi:hypothetical protein GQ457_03G045120 [Hibiscus cannabinus]